MNYSEDVLAEVEKYAGLLLEISEIALLVNISVKEFKREIKNSNSSVYKAYHRGKLKTKIRLRENVLKFAQKGSPQAEMLVEKYIDNQEISES